MQEGDCSVTIDSTSSYFVPIQVYCTKLLRKDNTENNNGNSFVLIKYDFEENVNEPEIVYGIPYGNVTIKHNDNIINVEHKQIGDIKGLSYKVDIYKEITISSNTMENLDAFLLDCYEDSKPKQDKSSINIFKWGTYWEKLSSLTKRSLDTIYLEDEVIKDIHQDILNFMKQKDEYAKFGIPYKKNYLFSGVPGTGKTSFIFSLASEINYSIYTIMFTPDINDDIFSRALKSIKSNSVLVLEDVDALFIERDTKNKTFLSFSGLINILDGLARKEGLIIFLTTNHIKRLDEALIRPGRIDKYVEFTYATKNQIRKMYKAFVPNQLDKMERFLDRIESIKTTTAILQKFFFEKRNCDDISSNDCIKDLRKLSESYVKEERDYSSMLYS